MTTLEQSFKLHTRTTNGDDAFTSSTNPYVDIIFRALEGRKRPDQIANLLPEPRTSTEKDFNYYFSMFIRDPRLGLGERELGRELLYRINLLPADFIIKCGRADDIFWIGYKFYKDSLNIENKYWSFLYENLLNPNSKHLYFIKKWMPRERGKNKEAVLAFRKKFNLTSKQYRKLIVNTDTVEHTLSQRKLVENYSHVPSLAMLKYSRNFNKNDYERFQAFKDKVKAGIAKINVSVTTPVDIWENERYNRITPEETDMYLKALPEVNLGKFICVVDQSGSMFDINNSYLKARAIGHYVSSNSSYMTNKIIVFSDYPRLLDLSTTFESAKEVFDSFHDIGYTNFGEVMRILSKADEDLPDYILVLSDMQFNEGSSEQKDEAMEVLKKYNPNLKIIWWNFNSNKSTFPETDEYGNIFISGYNPRLLSLLESGFDAWSFVQKLVANYKTNINK